MSSTSLNKVELIKWRVEPIQYDVLLRWELARVSARVSVVALPAHLTHVLVYTSATSELSKYGTTRNLMIKNGNYKHVQMFAFVRICQSGSGSGSGQSV